MTDGPIERPLEDAQALGVALQELTALRRMLHESIDQATGECAVLFGYPVDPDMLAGVLLLEVGQIALQWAAVQGRQPDDVAEYFDSLLRRARRGFRVQLAQALNQAAAAPQNQRIVTP